MAKLTTRKTHILDDAGYAYSFDRELYINRKTKKAFSVDYVDDHSEERIREDISEHTDGLNWKFYFNSTPSDGIKRELERVLG